MLFRCYQGQPVCVLGGFRTSFNSCLRAAFNTGPVNRKGTRYALGTSRSGRTFNSVSAGTTVVLTRRAGHGPHRVTAVVVRNFRRPAVRHVRVTKPNFLGVFLGTRAFRRLTATLFARGRRLFGTPTAVPHRHVGLRFMDTGPAKPLRFNRNHNNVVNSILTGILTFTKRSMAGRFCVGSTNSRVAGLNASLRVHYRRTYNVSISLPRRYCTNSCLVRLTGRYVRTCNVTILNRRGAFFRRCTGRGVLTRVRGALASCNVSFSI